MFKYDCKDEMFPSSDLRTVIIASFHGLPPLPVELEMSMVRESQDPTTAGRERTICGETPATGPPIRTADLVALGHVEYDGHLLPTARQGAFIDA